jgi:hypothetical protein
MLNEIKVALRGLAKSPGFTIIAILTVALAIGANSAVFSLINALLVRPLPYHDPARLVLLWEQFTAQRLDRIPVSAPEYLDFEKDFKSSEQIATFDYTAFNLASGSVPERISGAVVSPALFPMLGVDVPAQEVYLVPVSTAEIHVGTLVLLDPEAEAPDDRLMEAYASRAATAYRHAALSRG